MFDLYEYHSILRDNKILLNYKGPLDTMILERIVSFIRNSIGESKEVRKVVSIFVELAQNITRYSAEVNYFGDYVDVGVGNIILYEENNCWRLIAGNLIDSDDLEVLSTKIDKVNSLDYQSLRSEKRAILKSDKKEGQRGASIGLIDVAMKTDRPLKVYVTQTVDVEYAYFAIEAEVKSLSKIDIQEPLVKTKKRQSILDKSLQEKSMIVEANQMRNIF